MARSDYYLMARLEVLTMDDILDVPHDDQTVLESERAAFSLLKAGVPLSLLLDLALPVHSLDLLREEQADTSWVPQAVSA